MESSGAHSKTSEEVVEIWFQIQKDHEGYPKSQDWEELWASPVEHGRFRVESTPFFVKDIAFGDIVSAAKTDEGWYKFEQIISRSGNSSFRIWLKEGVTNDRETVVRTLKELGCSVQVTLERLIAIGVSQDRENEVWEYLEAGRDRDAWAIQIGFSPD